MICIGGNGKLARRLNPCFEERGMSGWDHQQAGAWSVRSGVPGGAEALTFEYQVGAEQERRRQAEIARSNQRLAEQMWAATPVLGPVDDARRPARYRVPVGVGERAPRISHRPAGIGTAALVTCELAVMVLVAGVMLHAHAPTWALVSGGVGLFAVLMSLFVLTAAGFWIITLAMSAFWVVFAGGLGQNAFGPLGMIVGCVLAGLISLAVHHRARVSLRQP